VKAVFGTRFKTDLLEAEARYAEISPRLAGSLRERIAGQVREIIRWGGGDHVGPHGFPCRRTKPFPYYIYYKIEGDSVCFLSIVHERRHPEHLKDFKKM
jgi:hypothetical protein